ncbi:MAG TPA: hypothetical protein VGY31_01080 [Terriglobia bacterium]|nr:hypothetical protein [Terriglobia bacterium]
MIWQGVRNGREQAGFQRGIQEARSATHDANKKLDSLSQQQKQEVARREQAERDLAIMVQATGQSTKETVLSQDSNSAKTNAERRKIRIELGKRLSVFYQLFGCWSRHRAWEEYNQFPQNYRSKPSALLPEEWASCQQKKRTADAETEAYLGSHLDSSYVTRFKEDEEGWFEIDASRQFLMEYN